MFWIIAFLITLLGSAAQLLLGHQPLTLVHSADVSLRWIVIFFYGVITLVAGLQHILNPDRIAQYIGWPAGSGFQLELGWAEVGLGVAACLGFWLPTNSLLGIAVASSVLYLGAAFVHAQEIARKGNLNPGNAGPVFYVDMLIPILTVFALLIIQPWP